MSASADPTAAEPVRILDRDILIVVDVQNDFCPGGALAVPRGDEIVPVLDRIGRWFPRIILTQDWHPPGHHSFASHHPGRRPYESALLPYGEQVLWPDHCVQGTLGAEFHPGLRIPQAELILRKGYRREIDSYSVFFENDRTTSTGLSGYLRERGFERIFLAGLATDFCVLYSALDGRRLGFEVLVLEEACRGIDLAHSLEDAWKRMARAGVRRLRNSEISA
jgi:nicotinamidase-related amidase